MVRAVVYAGVVPSLIHEPDRPRKPWRVDYWVDGRPYTRRFATKKEAQVLVGAVAKGGVAASTNLTLRQWIPRWIETHGPEWERRTLKERSEAMDELVAPTLGGRRLRDLTRRHVREWRSALVAAGVTAYRAQRATSILSACLGDAVDDDLIAANPCAGLGTLKWRRTPQDPATIQEVEAVRAHLHRPGDRAAVSLMAYAGLRPGEVIALEWADVQAESIVVRRGAGRESGETKTGSVRTVPAIGVLRDDLQALDRAGGLVVGVRNWNNWAGRVWRPAARAAGVERAPKVLRHTAASLWIQEGRDVQEVAYLLGHSTTRLVHDTYGHLFREAQLDRRRPNIQAAAAKARRVAVRAHAASLRERTARAA